MTHPQGAWPDTTYSSSPACEAFRRVLKGSLDGTWSCERAKTFQAIQKLQSYSVQERQHNCGSDKVTTTHKSTRASFPHAEVAHFVAMQQQRPAVAAPCLESGYEGFSTVATKAHGTQLFNIIPTARAPRTAWPHPRSRARFSHLRTGCKQFCQTWTSLTWALDDWFMERRLQSSFHTGISKAPAHHSWTLTAIKPSSEPIRLESF